MLVDSNLIIYATQPPYALLRSWLVDYATHYSAISRLETLAKLSAVMRELHPSVGNTFKDSYVLEFLGLPYLSMRRFWIGICRKEVHHDCA